MITKNAKTFKLKRHFVQQKPQQNFVAVENNITRKIWYVFREERVSFKSFFIINVRTTNSMFKTVMTQKIRKTENSKEKNLSKMTVSSAYNQ